MTLVNFYIGMLEISLLLYSMSELFIYVIYRSQYAKCEKMLGNGRLTATCFDGKQRLCHIRGKMRKKIWINVGDIILLGLRDFQDDKADVIQKFTAEEARRLKQLGHLPDNVMIQEDQGTLIFFLCAKYSPVYGILRVIVYGI